MAGPNVRGMVNDPQFLGLAPADQRAALSQLTGDTSFSQLGDGDTLQFVAKMSGGMNLRAPVPKPTAPAMQLSNLGIAAGSENGPSSAIANPQQPAEQFALNNPEQQGKLALAAGIGAAGTAGVMGGPALVNAGARAALPYATALGTWAKANPMAAKALIELVKFGAYTGAGYKGLQKILNATGR